MSFLHQAHPWFSGVDWDKLYQMEAAFIPEVNDELDTQNFEKFEEVLMSHVSFRFSSMTLRFLRMLNMLMVLFLTHCGFGSQKVKCKLHLKLALGEK